jgi:diguanylate cyclase (GGDEF)-like protein
VRAAEKVIGEVRADPVLYDAMLRVHREMELAGQVRALLETARAWIGATFAIGFGAASDGRILAPVVEAGGEDDPRLQAFSSVSAKDAALWLAASPSLASGLGAFAGAVADGAGGLPARSIALAVHDSSGKVAGALVVGVDVPPSDAALGRLVELIARCRPAIDNGLRVLALRELVIKDDTAHCFNRRYFEEFLPEELARASRFRSPVSLIFLDMDNLKQVNNRHGHAVGSRILREVATRVRGRVRKFDKLFRFGGDEFCIVLPETAWHGALEVAERVKEAISARPFLEGEIVPGVPMSASLGIASFPLHARTQADLIERADRAMQRVKGAGKNAIGVAALEGDGHGE